MIYNLGNKKGAENALIELNRLIELKSVVLIEKKSKSRTSQQNRALHLFFTFVADELNNLGIHFVYKGLKGHDIETEWTPLTFKEFTWKPIQKTLFGTETTTKLTTSQINKIVDVIINFFGEKGIEISFPNSFDYYLKFYEENTRS